MSSPTLDPRSIHNTAPELQRLLTLTAELNRAVIDAIQAEAWREQTRYCAECPSRALPDHARNPRGHEQGKEKEARGEHG